MKPVNQRALRLEQHRKSVEATMVLVELEVERSANPSGKLMQQSSSYMHLTQSYDSLMQRRPLIKLYIEKQSERIWDDCYDSSMKKHMTSMVISSEILVINHCFCQILKMRCKTIQRPDTHMHASLAKPNGNPIVVAYSSDALYRVVISCWLRGWSVIGLLAD